MDDVKIHECFPTLVHEFKFEQAIAEQEQMINYVKDLDDKGGYKRNILHEDIIFSALSNYIIMLCGEIMDKYDYEYDSLEISNMWANILGYGSIHAPHTHSNNLLSGTWYLKASDISSPMQFLDPRAQSNVLVPRKKKSNRYNISTLDFNSVYGTGFIFPSWLEHWVPQMTVAGDERISVSWNVIARGKYGDTHSLQNANF